MKKIFSIALLTIMSVTFIAVANAQSDVIPGLMRSSSNTSMKYEAKPGSTIEDSFGIQNLGEKKGGIEVYVVDSDETEKKKNDTQTSIGLWTTISEKITTVEPKEKKEIPFKIAIPADATIGKVYTGMIYAVAADTDIADNGDSKNSKSTGGKVKVTSTVSIKISVLVTDTPKVIAGINKASSDTPQNNGIGLDKILLLIVAALIISIGYLLYRKK